MYQLNNIRPIQICDLVRVGKQSGRGYVLPYRLIAQTRVLLSFDINNELPFEMDFLRTKKDAILYAFDYSVAAKTIGFRRREKGHFIKKLLGSQTDEKYFSIPEIFNRYLLTALDLSVLSKWILKTVSSGHCCSLSHTGIK
jgi:hypothetical protein